MNISQLLLNSAQARPNHPVIVFKEQRISYQELATKVKQKAVGFRQYGIQNNYHVGLMMGNKPEYIVTYFALLSVGAIVVPINPTFKENEITHILNDSEAVALIVDEIGLTEVQKAEKGFSSVNMIFSLQDAAPYVSWHDVSGDAEDYFIEQKNKDDYAQIIYTSGTTGKPKGALITHGNLEWMTQTSVNMLELSSEDRVLVVLPLFHAYAKLQGLLNSVITGSTIYLEERFIPNIILDRIAKEEITIFLGVPTMYTMFVNLPQINELDFSQLRVAGCGGASLPVEILEKVNKAMGVDIGEGYGQTESTVMISCFPPNSERVHGSVGYPLPGIELKVIDPNGKEVPAGEVGEIIFKGPNAMKGYYKKKQETRETIKDGWIYTGDLGKQDERGLLYIVDRKKDMIIRGGYNVYPREVEEVLYGHPDVVECAVVGESDPTFGEEIAAYVVVKQEKTPDDIITYCKEKLAHYKVPRKIYFMEELPKTTTGKILKTPLKNR
ncbi:class I adenylate-forming enzyme family protein [Peribacillus glennii]|uniref:Long-chain-fatty-acid--CoA ligase n=1 Tax=Peribacillus glennii TaxID=2303991 RepID=A0A372LGH6_9BACI|nr:long-chain fatty acid--CoA ligase [Peribacillus glennii]RFU64706.1 long-chain-fatty-acid--CoA ligase [Peribacillus glennii]